MHFLVGDGGGLEAISLLDFVEYTNTTSTICLTFRKCTENMCEKLSLHAESLYAALICRKRSLLFETESEL